MYQTPTWLVIGRMKAGWHASAAGGASSSGGTLEKYLTEAADGAAVYDGDACDYGDCAQHVMCGPILQAGMYGVKRFGRDDRQAASRMLPGLSGGFDTMVQLALVQGETDGDKYGSLDSVDWPTYKRLLSKLSGIRFGTVRNGQVVWET